MAYYQQPHDVTTLPAWQALQQHRAEMAGFSMREAFAADARRFQRFSLDSCGLLLDYSKNLIDERGLELLIQLAEQAGLQESIANLFNGEQVNASEGRAALHTALRSPIGRRLLVDGKDIIPEVHRVLNQVTELVSRIHSGLWRGYSEKPIKEVVNIGIGGSFLGPQLVSEALRPFTQRGVRCHYLANIDGSEFRELTARLDPETTLFIVSSKSFGTLETLKNTLAARDWYLAMGGPEKELHRHFIAVTSNRKAAIEFGIGEENIFPMWDWVGGRYSLWSAIGLPIMLYNNPATANVDLTPPVVARLSHIDNCRYIKESTLEVTRVRDILRLCGDRMTVFGGILGFESFVEGAEGWVAVASNLAPGPLARLFTLVADEERIREARELYLRYLPLISFVGGHYYVAGTKALLGHMGLPVGAPRPPRLPLPEPRDAEAREIVASLRLAI